jgi:AcrR family transcriptional regulator
LLCGDFQITIGKLGKENQMDGFTRRKEQSKEDIRKAAWELFSQFGMEKVSMADIARKAGVSQATIYNNFESKEALVRVFITVAVEQLVNRVHEFLTPKQQFHEKMIALMQFITEMMLEGSPSALDRAIFTSNFDLQNDPDIKKVHKEAKEKMTSLMLDLTQKGKQEGQVNPELSEEVLRIYFGIFMDAFINPDLHHRFYHHPSLVSDLYSLMMHGLIGKQE